MTAAPKSPDTSRSRLLNRPQAVESDLAFTSPPTPNNPVVRGYLLCFLSQVVARSSLLQNVLWSNAGFGQLRDRPELEGISPRYDPTVIKAGDGGQQTERDYLSTLTGEDWPAKKPTDSTFLSTLDYYEGYKSGRITPLNVIEALLPLIRRDIKPAASPHATAFLTTKVELVRRAAEESTQRWASGKPLSILDGVPMAVKDEADITGYPKSLGSKLDFTRKDDATSFQVRALQAAGAICIGKTNMHELGVDTTNCNAVTGTPRNPYAANYFCGGSSGGSAYAVGAGLVPFALGNDGGGSIRIPATYCGVYGLKTSAGRVSIKPTASLAKSTGVAGPIAANMVDLELAYRLMAQPDKEDVESGLFSAPAPIPALSSAAATTSNRLRLLGLCRAWIARADPAVQALLEATVTHLTTHAGYKAVNIHMPMVAEGQLAHAMTILAEINSGVSAQSLRSLSPATQILLSTGSRTPAADLLQAQKLRHLLMSHLAHLFAKYPGLVILTPTTPNAGWKAHPGDYRFGFTDANMQLRSMEYVWLANFTGCPSLSAPVGYVDAAAEGDAGNTANNDGEAKNGRVPVGIMGMTEWGDDEGCLGFGYDVEAYFNGAAGGEGDATKPKREKPRTFVDMMGILTGNSK